MAPGPDGGVPKLPKLRRDPGMKGVVPTQAGKPDEAQISWYSQCKSRWRQPEKEKDSAAKQSSGLPPISARGPVLVNKPELPHPFMTASEAQALTRRPPLGLPRSVMIARQHLPEDQRPSTAEIQEIAASMRVSMTEALAFCLPTDDEELKVEERMQQRMAKAESRRLAKAKEDLVEYRTRKLEQQMEEEKAKEEERKKQEEETLVKENKREKRKKYLKKRLDVLIHAKDEEERQKVELEKKRLKEEEKKEEMKKKYLQKQKDKIQQWHQQKFSETPVTEVAAGPSNGTSGDAAGKGPEIAT